MEKLREVVCALWDNHLTAFAESLEESDWPKTIRLILITVAAILGFLGSVALLLALLYAARSILIPLIGGPALVALMIASYRANKVDTPEKKELPARNRALLEEWADGIYPWVRDGVFLVLRTMSEYTTIIRPASPSAIETQARFYIKEQFAVFQFTVLCPDKLDLAGFKRDFERVLGQMLRAGELPGVPSKLVTVNGRNYLPLQVYTLTDMGSSINIDLVFADEYSLPHIQARRYLCVEQKSQTGKELPYDAEF